MRSSNQIAALDELRDSSETHQFRDARRFVVNRLATTLEDPEFRYQLLHRDSRTAGVQSFIDKMHVVGNFYETMGLFLKTKLIDRDILLEIWCSNAVREIDVQYARVRETSAREAADSQLVEATIRAQAGAYRE